ncbi:hypothetical protein WJX84_002802 [Apatococcus fuscideae]|uniref:alpha-amylase n=1 Tax=Apatococcus fuscideae TaxID=2026836 RepID=A0AAW1T2P1_9CHLO
MNPTLNLGPSTSHIPRTTRCSTPRPQLRPIAAAKEPAGLGRLLKANPASRLFSNLLAKQEDTSANDQPNKEASIKDKISRLASEAHQAAPTSEASSQGTQGSAIALRNQLDAVQADLGNVQGTAQASIPEAWLQLPQSGPLTAEQQDEIAQQAIDDKPLAPFLPPPELDRDYRPEGSGHELVLQAFNWESHHQGWWPKVAEQGKFYADLGFTVIWLPPPTDSVSAQGYMPRDPYNLQSRYGSEAELSRCVSQLQGAGLKVLADIVINHRCAHAQDKNGIWNQFGGRMAWDAKAIVLNDQIGFDGWRFDFVKGYDGSHVRDYVEATAPYFVIGEFWDTLSYEGALPKHNQDAHRQRTINWLNAAGGRATAFDVTLKGILHAVFERDEYWRLEDDAGKPPSVMGWWPSRAVTFLENHDTGSTQGHWRFPEDSLEQGYAYLMTHPGTPSVFLDHLEPEKLRSVIVKLGALRKQQGIHCRSQVKILRADSQVYVAETDGKLLMKMGPGKYSPPSADWMVAAKGKQWAIWERTAST